MIWVETATGPKLMARSAAAAWDDAAPVVPPKAARPPELPTPPEVLTFEAARDLHYAAVVDHMVANASPTIEQRLAGLQAKLVASRT
jgi:hypothetical protein